MTDIKGTRGRPRLPLGEKKVVLSVSVTPEAIIWLGTLQARKSTVVQKLLDDAMNDAGFAMPKPKPKPVATVWETCPACLNRNDRFADCKTCGGTGGEAVPVAPMEFD